MAGTDFVPGEQYVGENPDTGLYDVVVGGGLQKSFPSQSAAEDYYNSLIGGAPGGGGALGGLPTNLGIMPEIVDKQALIDLQLAQLELQRLAQEFYTAKMERVEIPSMEAERAYKEALIRLQEARDKYQEKKDLVDQQINIWREQETGKRERSRGTGLWDIDTTSPALPWEYSPENIRQQAVKQQWSGRKDQPINRLEWGDWEKRWEAANKAAPTYMDRQRALEEWYASHQESEEVRRQAREYEKKYGYLPGAPEFEKEYGYNPVTRQKKTQTLTPPKQPIPPPKQTLTPPVDWDGTAFNPAEDWDEIAFNPAESGDWPSAFQKNKKGY